MSDTPSLGPADRVGMVARLPEALWSKLCAACSGTRSLAPRDLLTRAGEPIARSALLLDGVISRRVSGGPGAPENRLLVALQVPGDFVDLHGLPLGRLDHDVCAVTASRLALFPHEALERIMADSAEDARRLWQLTMIDASIHRHWTFRSGQLRALASVADFLCEFELRMQLCGRVSGGRFPMPLLHSDLADVTGLSRVHVSRVMKDLRDAGLCTLRDGEAEIHDRAALRRLAGYDPGYLYLPDPDALD